MANNSISNIRSALSTKIGEVSEVAAVKSGKTQDFSGFPAVRYYLVGIENQQEDTASDYRTYRYTVDLIAPLITEASTEAELEASFQDAADALLDKLGDNWTLGGNADVLSIEPSPVRLEEFAFGPANVLSILVVARTLVTLS